MKTALDVACWDILARSLDTPLSVTRFHRDDHVVDRAAPEGVDGLRAPAWQRRRRQRDEPSNAGSPGECGCGAQPSLGKPWLLALRDNPGHLFLRHASPPASETSHSGNRHVVLDQQRRADRLAAPIRHGVSLSRIREKTEVSNKHTDVGSVVRPHRSDKFLYEDIEKSPITEKKLHADHERRL
ncbi:MAG: hypothetical protein OXF98_03890, partial [Rhodospirillaceae bacterium]|nr:hypothetical protein [Rhodospirillaceae bacterium]